MRWRDFRKLRHVPDPAWLKALNWLFLPFVVVAAFLDASDVVWLAIFGVALALAIVSLWLRSRRARGS